ncbi:Outer capsid protein VP2 [Frankliniella fusca]|uniref:Outer capsid protein VP2 n=1 Tax=Frankliniella fusca TaxID=407009 RepID=A0AAE1HTP5_9NEOP|nr:Outer capsid protein VP2 [Frankliniella fusca]
MAENRAALVQKLRDLANILDASPTSSVCVPDGRGKTSAPPLVAIANSCTCPSSGGSAAASYARPTVASVSKSRAGQPVDAHLAASAVLLRHQLTLAYRAARAVPVSVSQRPPVPEWPARTPVAAQAEVRMGRVQRRCECPRRNGLQDSCPLSGCRGRKDCLLQPFPECFPAQYLRRTARSG